MGRLCQAGWALRFQIVPTKIGCATSRAQTVRSATTNSVGNVVEPLVARHRGERTA
jgi:hypothetical protein